MKTWRPPSVETSARDRECVRISPIFYYKICLLTMHWLKQIFCCENYNSFVFICEIRMGLGMDYLHRVQAFMKVIYIYLPLVSSYDAVFAINCTIVAKCNVSLIRMTLFETKLSVDVYTLVTNRVFVSINIVVTTHKGAQRICFDGYSYHILETFHKNATISRMYLLYRKWFI